jgi:VIT1/CCC1 family predicted Fe2+/Mn2+ transporter
MGLTTRLAQERVNLSTWAAEERFYLSEDFVKAQEAARAWFTPAHKSTIAVTVGVALIVLGLALWSTTVALIVAGLSLLVYGAVLVDLDVSPPRRKRKKKVIE